MKEWKASEKEAQKMTRDGAISVNMVTGETSQTVRRSRTIPLRRFHGAGEYCPPPSGRPARPEVSEEKAAEPPQSLPGGYGGQ